SEQQVISIASRQDYGTALAVKKKETAVDQKTADKAALAHTCPVCQVNADLKTFKQHFESKHPKTPMVPVLVDVQT
uniref:Small EDRK-rich factor-like N-terminal domain-containing protein n=1 Tax=Oncorhynchus mykiss TaxID=8022 RepID=A0A8C7U8R2_ONCMY